MVEARQRARLLQEVGAAPVEGAFLARRAWPHAHGAVAVGTRDGVVLLDGDHGAETHVLVVVGNAEAAVADYAQDAVAASQNGIDRKHKATVQHTPPDRA